MELTEAEEKEVYLKVKEREAKKIKELEAKKLEYKDFTDETVKSVFAILMEASGAIKDVKKKVVDELTTLIEIKKEIYGDDRVDKQFSNTFSTKDGQFVVSIGQNTIDDYDDTVNEGIDKVNKFIRSLATNDDTKKLVDTILKLLSKDQKGNLKASRVLQLQRLAEEFGDESFLEGVKIIRDAYKPTKSSVFIKAFCKNERGEKEIVPLSITEV